ncbi:MAG: ABC transporter substrate-binding protein [Thermosynechococcaceae cyanobacterium]
MKSITLSRLPPVVYLLCAAGLAGLYLMQPVLKPFLPTWSRDPLASRRSLGQISFSKANASEAEQLGVQAFAKGDYAEAAQQFEQATQSSVTDPIPVIYAENARWLESPHLKVAAMVPLGSNREVALEMLRGLALTQRAYNRGPQKVVIEIFNDDNDPELADAIANKIVADPDIKVVIGPNASNAALKAGPIFNAAGLVMITPTSFANELSGSGDSIFRTTPSIRYLADTLADYSVRQVRRKKVAVCYDSDAADNLSFKEEFVNSLLKQGGTYVRTDCNFAAPDFDAKTMVTALISDGADAVLLTPHIDRLDRLIDLSRENKWRMVLLGSPSLETQKILDIGQGDLNGVVIPVPYHADMPTAQGFVNTVKQKFRVTPTWRTFASADALHAVLSVGDRNTSRQDFQQRLRAPTFQVKGAAETIRFLPTGDRIGNGVLAQIRPQSEGYSFQMLD